MRKIAEVEKLRLKFAGEESLLFKDISISIQSGEKVLFLGPSGCGKSTLLQVLTGLIPTSIQVPVKFESIVIPESWGYVFQDPDTQFCMPFVDEELAFVLENLGVDREQMPGLISDYLQQVGLYLDDAHTPIRALSQGMKQRLAIASILALTPEVLFLDEPTALLDPKGTEEVWETIRTVSRDKTVIIVEHKIDQIIDFIDRIILFDNNGRIIAEGSKDEIFQTYQAELIEYGIWYPNVWDVYLRRKTTQQLLVNREVKKEVMIELKSFHGLRGKIPKITIEDSLVRRGEWIGVVGENGAGKSTLLLSLMQLVKTDGVYKLDGSLVTKKTNLGNEIGFVFQNPEFQFITNTVYEELAYSLRLMGENEATISLKVQHCLAMFGLLEKQNQHPYQLSMGQKRRLSVATAIMKDQKVLLLDEPTFGQDAKNTFALLELIEEIRQKGTTIIMVTHDLHILAHFTTKVWLISKGKLVQDLHPDLYMSQLKIGTEMEETVWS
ncbi:ABC transporter ATP-binding protein [Bacillus suaedae]|uniref:ABC transporter ATP-binding protein n=1 Tax=Halalkalibacter suaedae TaxID=2822140 RepID=A0A941AQV6_9BACI|nr:ABC transporter ATP-binding protein [Bacillus suaedae]MBP3953231.1 ABC transporter ATP-binding protein [Bacillus suaedae]